MSKIPTISIGLPVFNGEEYLNETINSILNQTFSDFELIISDNASTDNTASLCQDYTLSDSRIKYFKQTNNIGFHKNYKYVLEKARGKFFMWFASDDLLSNNNSLMNLYKKFNHDTDYVFPDVSIINNRGQFVKHNLMSPFKNAHKKFDFAKASIHASAHTVYSLFRTNILKEDFYLLEKFKGFTSYWEGYFVHVVATQRKGVFASSVLKLWRHHENNTSNFIIPKKQLFDYLKYAYFRIKFFYNYNCFSIKQKIQLIVLMLTQNIYHIAILLKNLVFHNNSKYK